MQVHGVTVAYPTQDMGALCSGGSVSHCFKRLFPPCIQGPRMSRSRPVSGAEDKSKNVARLSQAIGAELKTESGPKRHERCAACSFSSPPSL